MQGRQSSIPTTLANAPSNSGPQEGPVQARRRKELLAARSGSILAASARGTARGSRTPVKPLMPTVVHEPMSPAAGSAGTSFGK